MPNLIIDGHGTDLTSSFNFQRTTGNESQIFSYVHSGISISGSQSDNIIAKIIANDYSKEITTSNKSRLGGTQLVDRLLSAIKVVGGNPEWNNDGLLVGGTTTTININGVSVDQILSGNNIYLRLPFGSTSSIKLSDIINHYNVGQYNFFWCVCR